VSEFRALILRAVCAGTAAGLLWFGIQYASVIPLIEKAETYEAPGHEHHEASRSAEDRRHRNAFTAISTVLTAIGFAAVLFGVATFAGQRLNVGRGALWGLAGFASVSLAPALGLPPQPPGVAEADLFDRQLWWTATAAATAVGLYLLAKSRGRLPKLAGAACLVLPHAVGAPAATGGTIVPPSLVTQFAVASIAAAGIFWLALGAIAGFINARDQRSSAGPADRS
jgi:cobalt transporter subunit CbtA